MARLEEIAAKYLDEKQRWGETVIIEIDGAQGVGLARAKGTADEDELIPGLWYRLYGRWSDTRWGRQFHFDSFCEHEPLDKEGLERYLVQAPRVGKAIARKLVARYGQDAIRTLRESPHDVAREIGVRGFSADAATEAAAYLGQKKATESAQVDLMTIFSGRGLPKKLVRKCIRRWGNAAANEVRENPYALIRFRGVGFVKADELYCDLGHDRAAVKRQGWTLWAACMSERCGSTWIDGPAAHSALIAQVGASEARPAEAARWAADDQLIEYRRDSDGRIWFAATERSQPERALAATVAEMIHYGQHAWPEIDGATAAELSEHQRSEIAKALQSRIALFGGSPGTGKTYTAARLIAAIIQHCGEDVAVLAPTGKAAVRITEALSGYGIAIRARTVHSYLRVIAGDEDEDLELGQGPPDDEKPRYVIVDESSMLDTRLLAALLGAMRMDAHVLLVGDVNQLPPVGHGAPLRDLIAVGVPRGELTEIRRNAGLIVETCAKIRDGLRWSVPDELDLQRGRNLAIRRSYDSIATAEAIVHALHEIGGNGVDPVWDCQVVCAVNERSQLSRAELNRRLRAELNVRNRPSRDAKFWRDDKVVCLKNSFFPAVGDFDDQDSDDEDDLGRRDDGHGQVKIYVANGELGRVIDDHEKKTIVEFSTPRRVVLVPKGDAGTSRLDLGYALSVHKAQGSEWPIVIVALDPNGGARMVCDRAWIYTAISRARTACLLFGRIETAHGFCRTQKIRDRKTFLVECTSESLDVIGDKKDGVIA